MSAIYILWLRQLKLYFRSKERMIGSIGQSLLFLVALGYGFGPIFRQAGDGNYIQFLVPGIIAMAVLFGGTFNGIEIIWDRQFGFLKETLVAPISRLQIMVGRTLGGVTVAMIQGLLVLLISFVIGFRFESIGLLPLMIIFMFLTALIFTALGTAIASVLKDMQAFHLIMNFLIMPTFFLSGALFPLQNLPEAMAWVTRINPLSYGVDGIRGALISGAYFGFLTDFLVLASVALVLLGLGSYLFSKIQI
jgi:ABC-2 type transport system permease protein